MRPEGFSPGKNPLRVYSSLRIILDTRSRFEREHLPIGLVADSL